MLLTRPSRLLQELIRVMKSIRGGPMSIYVAARDGLVALVQNHLVAEPGCVNQRESAPDALRCHAAC